MHVFSVTILKETLMEALNFIAPIVTGDIKKTNNDCLKISIPCAGAVRLFMYNPTESIEIDAVCSMVSATNDKAPLIKFDRIKDIISTFPDGQYVNMKTNQNNGLELSYGTKKPICLNSMSSSIYPTEPKIFSDDRKKGAVINLDFLEEASKKASRIITTSSSQVNTLQDYIKINIGNARTTAEGIDSSTKRSFFMKRNIGLESVPKDFLIKADRMAKISKIFKNYSSVYLYNNSAMTMTAADSSSKTSAATNNPASNNIIDVKYATLNTAGKFPDIAKFYDSKYMPKEFISVNKQEFLEAIDRATAILDTSNTIPQSLKINSKGSEFNVSYSSVYGSISEDIMTHGSINKPLVMAFKPKIIKDIVTNISDEYIEIGLMNNTQNNFLIRGSSLNQQKTISDDAYTLITLALAHNP